MGAFNPNNVRSCDKRYRSSPTPPSLDMPHLLYLFPTPTPFDFPNGLPFSCVRQRLLLQHQSPRPSAQRDERTSLSRSPV